jgi:hypothetical protein
MLLKEMFIYFLLTYISHSRSVVVLNISLAILYVLKTRVKTIGLMCTKSGEFIMSYS